MSDGIVVMNLPAIKVMKESPEIVAVKKKELITNSSELSRQLECYEVSSSESSSESASVSQSEEEKYEQPDRGKMKVKMQRKRSRSIHELFSSAF